MTDIKRQVEQQEILNRLIYLQDKARRRKHSISTHGFARDNQSEGNTGDYPVYMRPINGRWC